MYHRSDIVYLYDGGFQGFLCCVFQAFVQKENPQMILPQDEAQALLFETRHIETRPEQAERVWAAVPAKLGPEAPELTQCAFLSDLPDKELLLLEFLRQGFAQGPAVMQGLAREPLRSLWQAAQRAKHEAHLFTGFVRFSDCGGALTAVIHPKNQVLPLLADHFCQRFNAETFMIYDKTHQMALTHRPGRARIIPLEEAELPGPGQEERQIQALWRRFYQTLSIQGRENRRARQGHMPLRYWGDMTEFQRESPLVAPALPEGPLTPPQKPADL